MVNFEDKNNSTDPRIIGSVEVSSRTPSDFEKSLDGFVAAKDRNPESLISLNIAERTKLDTEQHIDAAVAAGRVSLPEDIGALTSVNLNDFELKVFSGQGLSHYQSIADQRRFKEKEGQDYAHCVQSTDCIVGVVADGVGSSAFARYASYKFGSEIARLFHDEVSKHSGSLVDLDFLSRLYKTAYDSQQSTQEKGEDRDTEVITDEEIEAFEIEEGQMRELNDWIRNKARYLLRDLSESMGISFLPKDDEALEQASFEFIWDDLSFCQLQLKD